MRFSVVPGLTLAGIVIALRLLGLFQPIEWKVFDVLMRSRLSEPTDERVTIVAIDEADIQSMVEYPITDRALAQLLQKLDQFNPRAVGIDIFRDLVVEPGHQDLVDTLEALPYVYGIEYVETEISPPPSLPAERVGFVDFPLDSDGLVRRLLLGRPNDDGEYRFALSVRLAEAYLAPENILLENGVNNPDAMRFGQAELPAFRRNTGGYIRASAESQQTLLNVRRGAQPFQIVSLREVMADNTQPEWIQDRVVLIGIISPSHKDIVSSGALTNRNPGNVYGVEMQAHAVSQILAAALDNRPLMRSLPDAAEYGWILCWGMVGIFLVGRAATPAKHLLWMLLNSGGLILLCYIALIGGWWLPLAPSLSALLINGLLLPSVLLYDQMLRSRVEEGQRVIQQTYNAVHNGPLQTLALLLREIDHSHSAIETLNIAPRLRQLNEEIRTVYDTLEQQIQPNNNQLRIESGDSKDGHSKGTSSVIALDTPLHETLYEVYTQTLKRDFPCFSSIRIKVVKFEEMKAQKLSIEVRRSLCRFLEEALCNVGRYAENITRLEVSCLATEKENVIMVEDNGRGLTPISSKSPRSFTLAKSAAGGRGTRQAKQLARQLKGQFSRTAIAPHGVRCTLHWPHSP